jgi:hypothetical protein
MAGATPWWLPEAFLLRSTPDRILVRAAPLGSWHCPHARAGQTRQSCGENFADFTAAAASPGETAPFAHPALLDNSNQRAGLAGIEDRDDRKRMLYPNCPPLP